MDYDEDGCYDPAKYLELVNHQNFQAYSTFIGSVMLGLGALGIVGNLLSIVVLLNKERVCFNYILVALNISDSLHIVFAVLDVVRNNHQESYPHFLLSTFPYFHYPLYRYSPPSHSLARDVLQVDPQLLHLLGGGGLLRAVPISHQADVQVMTEGT